MKRATLFLTCLLACVSQLAFADGHSCSPCEHAKNHEARQCMGDWELSGNFDWLYWKPCRTELTLPDGSDNRVALNPGHDSGFRFEARTCRAPWDLNFRYTTYDSSDSMTVDGNRLRYKVDLSMFDLEAGHTFNWDMCAMLRPFVGMKIACIEEDYLNENNGNDDKLEGSGCGLSLGTEGRWLFWNWAVGERHMPVSLVMRACASLMNSEIKSETENEGNRAKECLILPVYEGMLGLEFRLCDLMGNKRGSNLNLLVGYEVQSWSWREIDSSDDLASLGFSGLVLRFGLGY